MLDHKRDCTSPKHGTHRCQRTTQGGREVNYGVAVLNHDTNRFHVDPEDGQTIDGDFGSLGEALMALDEHRRQAASKRLDAAQKEFEEARDISDTVGRPME